jgi:hypothetical protein
MDDIVKNLDFNNWVSKKCKASSATTMFNDKKTSYGLDISDIDLFALEWKKNIGILLEWKIKQNFKWKLKYNHSQSEILERLNYCLTESFHHFGEFWGTYIIRIDGTSPENSSIIEVLKFGVTTGERKRVTEQELIEFINCDKMINFEE